MPDVTARARVDRPPAPVIAHADWLTEARRRFGDDALQWRFVCPRCGANSSSGDFEAAGAEPSRAAQECIGRVTPDRGCDWAAFGLLDICTVHVQFDGRTVPVFAFAEGEPADSPEAR